MPTASELKRGMNIEIEGDPYQIMDIHFQSPSARGASTLVKAKIRNLRTGNVFDRTFRSADRVGESQLERRAVQYLYAEDDTFHFMDAESYDQLALKREEIGDVADYLIEGLAGIRSVLFNDRVISIELPQSVVLRVEQTDPALKGATAQAQTKPAQLQTGLTIQVPSYIETGDSVQVDTREARFIGRAKGS
jgi:elongation factor P